jgi:hypothetical protein
VLARLRHLARFFRLALVCLTLAWTSAPAASAPVADTIALVALTPAAAKRPPADPADRATQAPKQASHEHGGQPLPNRPAPLRGPGAPRRLYLEHRALLC